MSLAYLTASFPYGSGESFIASEINFHLKRDNKFYLIPLWARGNLRDIEICTNKKMILLERRLFSFKMIYYFIYFVFSKPVAFISILKLVFKSKSRSKPLPIMYKCFIIKKYYIFKSNL